MNVLFDRLDAEQKRIVHCDDKAMYVAGVVGSGKTDTLIAKIIHMIHNKDVSPDKIFVLAYHWRHHTESQVVPSLRGGRRL